MNTAEAKRVLETALICAQSPMPLPEMRALFDGELGLDTLRTLLNELSNDWQDKGVELVALASGWRFQSRPELRVYLDRLHPEKPPKYSRAAMETLAIVAYRQPVTRGDIEDIRGVTVSSQIVKQLEDRGWIDAIGYREAPGRPALYATTKQFLDDLGLASLDQLPAIDVQTDAGQTADALAALQTAPLLGEDQGDLVLDAANDAMATSDEAAEAAEVTEATEATEVAASAAPAAVADAPAPQEHIEPETNLVAELAAEPVAQAEGPHDTVAAEPSPSVSPTDATTTHPHERT